MFCTFLNTNRTCVASKFLRCRPRPKPRIVGLCLSLLTRSFASSRHGSRPAQLFAHTLSSRFVQTDQVHRPYITERFFVCTKARPRSMVSKPNVLSRPLQNRPSPNLIPKLNIGRVPFVRSEKTSSNSGQGIHENISSLQMKKRPLRRKLALDEKDVAKPGFWSVVAYTTAEEYDLEKLAVGLQEQDLYEVCPWECGTESSISGTPDVVYARALYQVGSEPREIFLFREGSLVLWNVPDLEVDSVLQFVRQYEHNSYDARLLTQESESMKYTYTPPGKKSHIDPREGNLFVGEEAGGDHLAKYTFSNAMALSVKLGVWEASLDRYVDSIEFVTEDLKQGTRISMSRDEVLRKTGQLFALRHLINLSSDLLDTPDFYWDRDELEALYLQTCNYFSIARRTKVMNEKLNHCVELVELLSDHLNDRHHVRLEWMIIILIMVEVGFEVIHYAQHWSA